MDRGKILLSVGVGCYLIALIFFWIATSGIQSGWYTKTEGSTTFDYGALKYTLTIKSEGAPSDSYVCLYSGNSPANATTRHEENITMCVDFPDIESSGEFVIVDTILTWLCLMPTFGILVAFAYFKPSLGLAKVAWGLGAVTFFWSIWAWLVFGIKFGGTGSSPSWAWALDFVAFLLTAAGLALSIAGVRCGSESYEVMGGGDVGGGHELIE